MHVLATAGHVDHGKSTLVRALTGTDPDRLREEKARGLTIDLGFAWTQLPSGAHVAFVDVPGHVRFLKNMLAGVGSVAACLFVVAATEGWKPQSEEHLRILELLGASHGVVVLTKAGLVDEELREIAHLDVVDHLQGSFLAGAEVIPVDSLTGTGLDQLRAALDRLVQPLPAAVDLDRPRLWIDRTFVVKGSGTVVTGTLTGGSLRVGDELVVAPSGRSVRVRGLQSLEQQRDVIGPGSRAAVNLVGIGHRDTARGDALVRPGQWPAADTFDATLRILPSLGHDVRNSGAYAIYVGSGEHPAQVRIIGAKALQPGTAGTARFRIALRLPLRPGDRFVLREHGRAETVGGGEVLDVAPVLPVSKAAPSRDPWRVVRERAWVDAAELELLTGERLPASVGRWVVAPEALERARSSLAAAVSTAGPLGLDIAQLDDRQRAVLRELDVTIQNGRATPASAVDDPLDEHPYVEALRAQLFSPPEPIGVDRAELRELVRRGRVIERDGVWFAPEAVAAACTLVRQLVRDRPDGFTVSDFREAASTTRKYAVPLLSQLDATGRTRRRGELRQAGPRLDRV